MRKVVAFHLARIMRRQISFNAIKKKIFIGFLLATMKHLYVLIQGMKSLKERKFFIFLRVYGFQADLRHFMFLINVKWRFP